MTKQTKQKQIMLYVVNLLSQADKKFLEKINNKNELIKELSSELFFIGAFTRSYLENHVIPFMEENAVEIYEKKEKILKGEILKVDEEKL